MVPLGLGVYGALAGFTTWISVAELLAWDESVFGWDRKVSLGGLYALYGVICKFIPNSGGEEGWLDEGGG